MGFVNKYSKEMDGVWEKGEKIEGELMKKQEEITYVEELSYSSCPRTDLVNENYKLESLVDKIKVSIEKIRTLEDRQQTTQASIKEKKMMIKKETQKARKKSSPMPQVPQIADPSARLSIVSLCVLYSSVFLHCITCASYIAGQKKITM